MSQNLLYRDLDNQYILLDYAPTHSQLLFRKMKNKSDPFNIDIVFKPARKIIVADKLEGISIRVISDKKVIDTPSKNFGFATSLNYKIFQILDSSNNSYFVNALFAGVFENQLDLFESSLGDFLDFGYPPFRWIAKTG